jgi:glucokinase
MKRIVLGADIGGSHITAALIDLDKKNEIGKTRCRARLDTNASTEEIIEAWAHIIEDAMNRHTDRPAWISIAMPGPMDYKNGICLIRDQGKYGALYNVNLKKNLHRDWIFLQLTSAFATMRYAFYRGRSLAGA